MLTMEAVAFIQELNYECGYTGFFKKNLILLAVVCYQFECVCAKISDDCENCTDKGNPFEF